MSGKRIAILIVALAVSALIVWNDLPIEFPGAILKVMMLVVKLFVVTALAVVAYIFAGGKTTSS